MSVILEAWTLPSSGSFQKVVGPIPYRTSSADRKFLGIGNGYFTITSQYARLTAICDPLNNVETLIRVFEDGVNTYSWFARNVDKDMELDGDVVVSGPGIESELEKAINYPFDWADYDGYAGAVTDGRTEFPDTIYGGDNLLSNPDFDDAGFTNMVQGMSHDRIWTSPLNGAITDTATSLVVDDGGFFPASDFVIRVGSELMHVTTRSGNTLSGLTRGYKGTTAAAHSDDEDVFGGGWFTLTFQGQTTGRLEWNATAEEIENALIALNNIIDVDVTGTGTVNSDPWMVEFIDPGEQDLPLMTVDLTNLPAVPLGNQFNIVEKIRGGKGRSEPWTRSTNMNTQQEHGGYDAFDVGSTALYGDPAHSGDHALGINPAPNTNYAGAQQIVPVDPGGLYQASIWVYTVGSGQSYRLVLRDLNEKLLSFAEIFPQPNTWTQAKIENWKANPVTRQVIFRLGVITPGGGDQPSFWIDDALFAEGLQPTTAGQIIQNMFNTAQIAESRPVLTWLKRDSFNGVQDSNSDPWLEEEMKIVIPRGMTFFQVLGLLVDRGYEWKIEWNAGAGQYELLLYNPGNAGTDRTGSLSPRFASPRITSLLLRRTTPSANTVLGEGDAGLVREVQDAALVAAYGRREAYVGDGESLDLDTLQRLVEHNLDIRRAEKIGVKVELDGTIRLGPGLECDLGDVVNTFVPDDLPQIGLRIFATLLLVDRVGKVTRTVDVGKYVYRERLGGTTSTATSTALNALLRRFRRLERAERKLSQVGNLVGVGGSGKPYLQYTQNGDIFVGAGVVEAPGIPGTITSLRVRCAVAPQGKDAIADIFKNGVSQLGVNGAVVPAGANQSDVLLCSIPITDADYIQVGWHQVGSTISGGTAAFLLEVT